MKKTTNRGMRRDKSRYLLPWTVLIILLVVGLIPIGISLFCTKDWNGFALNIGTEFVGTAVTYFLLTIVLGSQQEKEKLIAEMGSNVKDVAIGACEELRLRHRQWFTDGSLNKKNFSEANLEGANLSAANLESAYFFRANLEHAELMGANLARAVLFGSKLKCANLHCANLEDAELDSADLVGVRLQDACLIRASLRHSYLNQAQLGDADFMCANLGGADLRYAYLGGVNFQQTDLSEVNLEGVISLDNMSLSGATLKNAILPDGTKLGEENWKEEFNEWCKKQQA